MPDFDGVTDGVLDLDGVPDGVNDGVLDLEGVTEDVLEGVPDLEGVTEGVIVLVLLGLPDGELDGVLEGVPDTEAPPDNDEVGDAVCDGVFEVVGGFVDV